MPATLQNIRGKTVELQVFLGDPETPVEERSPDDSFTLHYRQHSVTGETEALARKAEKEERFIEALCEMCSSIFVKWDLKFGATAEQMDRLDAANRRGDVQAVQAIEREIKETVAEQEPIPITKEGLIEYVPASVLVLILEQINESRRPNESVTAQRLRRS